MVRPSKSKTNLLCVDIGHERKEKFANCLPRSKSVTDALKEYMDSVIDEQKKEEALGKLPILASEVRQSSMYEYVNISINNLLELSEDFINEYIKTVDPKKLDLIYRKLGRFATCIAIMD